MHRSRFRPDKQTKLEAQKFISIYKGGGRYNFRTSNLKLDIICITKFRNV